MIEEFMVLPFKTIHIEPLAAAKPALGEPCNGCGVCCLVAPCPLGVLISRRRHGVCNALRWEPALEMYRCGAMTDPLSVTTVALPDRLGRAKPFVARAIASVLRRLAERWIASGQGCDCSLVVDKPPGKPASELN
jgi:hypothetical protein